MSAKKVSPFSATMIGLHDGVNTNHAAKFVFSICISRTEETDLSPVCLYFYREIFRNEAKEVTTHLQGIHHARKIGHMQVNYSDTVNKLSKFQQNVPVEMNTQGVSTQMRTSRPLSDQSNMKLSEYNKQMSTYIAVERDINERKREFNREAGRKAEVSTV